MTHHAHVSKRDPAEFGFLFWPWQVSCVCGAFSFGTDQQTLFELAFEHVRQNTDSDVVSTMDFSEELGDEPVDMLPLMKTRLAWDLLDHGDMNHWRQRLGLTPVPPDVEEMEHRAAHERALNLGPMSALAETCSAIIAEIQAEWFTQQHEDIGDEITEEQKDAFIDTAFRMIRTAVFAVLIEFLHEGVISHGPVFVYTGSSGGQ